VKEFTEEAQRMGIEVLGPDINTSFVKFDEQDGKIRSGLGAIKGMGTAVAQALVDEREKSGDYLDLPDLCTRWDSQQANKTCYEALIKAGGFDSTGWTRRACFETFPDHLREAQHILAEKKKGQALLFFGNGGADGGDKSPVPPIEEWEEKEFLAHEKEALGFYLSGHPFKKRGAFYSRLAACDSRRLAELHEAQQQVEVTLAGMISSIRRIIIKSGRNAGQRMARFRLEDLHGQIQATVFSRQYQEVKERIVEDALVFVKGRLDLKSEDPSILVDQIIPAEDYVSSHVDALVLHLDERRHDKSKLDRVYEIVRQNRSRHRLILQVPLPDGSQARLLADPDFQIRLSDALLDGVADILGPNALSYAKV